MFSSNYFKYLIKSKLALIIVAVGVEVLVAFNSYEADSLYPCIIYTLFLSYLFPIITLSFVSDSKAVDTYFSLPISRLQLLITNLIFNVSVLFISYLVGYITFILRFSYSFDVIHILLVLLCIAMMISFNSLLYLLGNKRVDSIILLGAYTVLPFALIMVCNSFASAFIAGIGYGDIEIFNFLFYLSPVCLSIETLFLNTNYVQAIQVIFIIIHLVLWTYLLVISFKNRKVEGVNSITDHKFGYKLIIPIYAFICLIGVCSSFTYSVSLSTFLLTSIPSFIMILILMIAANFIYERKFTISVKYIVTFLILLAISLGITFSFRFTNGFNIANKIDITKDFTKSDYYAYYGDNEEVINFITAQTNSTYDSYSIEIESSKCDDSIIKIKDKFIDSFYNPVDGYSYSDYEEYDIYNSCLYIYTNNNLETEKYYYNSYVQLSLDELIELSKDDNNIITITVEDNNTYTSKQYQLVNGKLS